MFCSLCLCPTSKLPFREGEEQPQWFTVKPDRLRDWPQAWHGQQLNLSHFCRQGAGCYCKPSAGLSRQRRARAEEVNVTG